MAKVSSAEFYSEYHGHRVEHLEKLLAATGDRPRIFLVGDSSLDNKYYLPAESRPAGAFYDKLLQPPCCRGDVAYWLHDLVNDKGYVVVNAAVEESTLAARGGDRLLPQDELVRDNMRPDDVLVCSVGGNDVALRPTLWTALAAAKAVYLNGDEIRHPERAWGMPHFQSLFRDDTTAYLRKLVAKTRPRCVVPCMIYFLHEDPTVPSWAAASLRLLKYDDKPQKLQRFIRAAFQVATSQIALVDIPVVPCSLYEAMDGKDSALYVARVEPSEAGAKAIAELLYSKIRPMINSKL